MRQVFKVISSALWNRLHFNYCALKSMIPMIPMKPMSLVDEIDGIQHNPVRNRLATSHSYEELDPALGVF